jgi:ACS family glucarate transporter-like MFS transporter
MESAAEPVKSKAKTAPARRWAVLAALFSLAMLTIVDRVAISAAKGDMSRDLGLTDVTFGLIFGSFALGYALFQIPAGYFADRFGPRRVVAAVVIAWSLLTTTTAMVRGAALLIGVRFLFGAAEAGAFPASARAIRSWLPVRETGIAQGVLFGGSRLGAAFGLTLVSWLVAWLNWRAPFFILGAAGIAWVTAWLFWFRNTPEEVRDVSETELAYIRAGRADPPRQSGAGWTSAFGHRETIPLLVQYFASNFTFFLCYSWLLPYLRDRYHLSIAAAGLYAAIPLYCGAAANWVSGAAVDTLYRRNWGRLSRILPAAAGFLLGAAALVGAVHAVTIAGAVGCFAAATFGVDLTLSPSWTLCIDIAGDRTGTLSGAMNMFGNIGSFVSSVAFPLLLRWTGASDAYFYCAAAINLVAAGLWMAMRERDRLRG